MHNRIQIKTQELGYDTEGYERWIGHALYDIKIHSQKIIVNPYIKNNLESTTPSTCIYKYRRNGKLCVAKVMWFVPCKHYAILIYAFLNIHAHVQMYRYYYITGNFRVVYISRISRLAISFAKIETTKCNNNSTLIVHCRPFAKINFAKYNSRAFHEIWMARKLPVIQYMYMVKATGRLNYNHINHMRIICAPTNHSCNTWKRIVCTIYKGIQLITKFQGLAIYLWRHCIMWWSGSHS